MQQLLHPGDELPHRGCVRLAILVDLYRSLPAREELARKRRGDLVLMHHGPRVIRLPLGLWRPDPRGRIRRATVRDLRVSRAYLGVVVDDENSRSASEDGMTAHFSDAVRSTRSDTGVTAMPPPGLVSGRYDRFCRIGEEQIGSGMLLCVREVRVRWYEGSGDRWRVWNPVTY